MRIYSRKSRSVEEKVIKGAHAFQLDPIRLHVRYITLE